MLPLRHAGLWRKLSLFLLVVVMLAALSPAFWFDSKFEALTWFRNTDKWLHGLTFCILTAWFTGLFDRQSYWRIAVGLMLFGLFIEACQLAVGYRMADWVDIGANTLGILVGMALAAAGLGGWGLRAEAWYAEREQA